MKRLGPLTVMGILLPVQNKSENGGAGDNFARKLPVSSLPLKRMRGMPCRL
jgi:hypothetical protein